MSTINKVMVSGRLGHKPTLQSTKNGQPFCRLQLATDSWKKNSDGQGVQWITIHVFGKKAENASLYMDKGKTVLIEGRLEIMGFDKEGAKDGASAGSAPKKDWRTFVTAEKLTYFGVSPSKEGKDELDFDEKETEVPS